MLNQLIIGNSGTKIKILLVRWTFEFDTGYETNWWYTIKDEKIQVNLQEQVREVL